MPDFPLKTVAWLLKHRHDPKVRLLDCRFSLTEPGAGRAAYEAGHIPGAVYADLNQDLSAPVRPDGVGGRHPLPAPDALAAWLGGAGIGHDRVVVCYDDPSTGQGFYAARAWWLLRWLGQGVVGPGQVYVLDGGWPAYLAAGGLPSTQEAAPSPTTFRHQVQWDMLATAQDVQGRDAAVALLDARAPERYRGEVEPLDRQAGHIPGAINRPWNGALDERGFWHDAAAQAQRLAVGDAPSIMYCGSGVSAAPNALARELAGIPLGQRNRLYAGSWSDWISDDTRPVATGAAE